MGGGGGSGGGHKIMRNYSSICSFSVTCHMVQTKSGFVCVYASTTPVYLTELVKAHKLTRQLRSCSDTSILCLPSVHTHLLGQR